MAAEKWDAPAASQHFSHKAGQFQICKSEVWGDGPFAGGSCLKRELLCSDKQTGVGGL